MTLRRGESLLLTIAIPVEQVQTMQCGVEQRGVHYEPARLTGVSVIERDLHEDLLTPAPRRLHTLECRTVAIPRLGEPVVKGLDVDLLGTRRRPLRRRIVRNGLLHDPEIRHQHAARVPRPAATVPGLVQSPSPCPGQPLPRCPVQPLPCRFSRCRNPPSVHS